MLRIFCSQVNRVNNPKQSCRNLWGLLNSVTNRVDEDRVKEIGADLAAAEWLVRNGASIRWQNSEVWEKDYNRLKTYDTSCKIEAIDATDSSIMNIGFPYLKGLKNLEIFIIKRNHYVGDDALQMLSYVKESLLHLEIVSCSAVTDDGICSLSLLHKLQYLKLFDLEGVKNQERCIKILKDNLKKAEIEWPIN